MKYSILILSIILISSCENNDTKTETNTVEQKTDNATRDSAIPPSTIQLTPEEEKDDSNFADGSITTSWKDAGINDPKALKLFIKKLKQWSVENNKDSIAAYIDYPLQNDEKISSATIFLQQYNIIFNDKVKRALNDQNLSQVFRRRNGVVIGDGEIWINNVSTTKDDYKITSIHFDK